MQQLFIALSGMAVALVIAVRSLPIGFSDAVHVAKNMGRMNPIDFVFDLTTPYNFWSGLFGGLMVALAYFGTDQSQVQRYLTGETITESRLGLLFNGLVKVPMQFFILFVGVMVFVFYQFVAPPLSFDRAQRAKIEVSPYAAQFHSLEREHATAFAAKRAALLAGQPTGSLEKRQAATRDAAQKLILKNDPKAGAETDYIFLTFIIQNLPTGVVGLLLAAIFCAAMSATASGLNSLASTSVIDVFRRLVWRDRSDHAYVRLSKAMTVFWGVFCIGFGLYANRFGALIVAVNVVGSLFYGTMLAIFLVAFYIPRIGGTAMFYGAIIAFASVLACAKFTDMAWLWWNVVGCVVGVVAAIVLQLAITSTSQPAA